MAELIVLLFIVIGVVYWLRIRRRVRKRLKDSQYVENIFIYQTLPPQKRLDIRKVKAAAEILAGSHHRIYMAHGEFLGKIDITKEWDIFDARLQQHRSDAAWKLAKDYAVRLYGYEETRAALDQLGLQ